MRWIAVLGGGLLGVVALAVIVLILLGLRGGAGRIAGSVEIDRPPASVWPWIIEADRLLQWVGWLTEVHDLTPGVEGIGARRRWVMIDPTLNNRRVEIDGEVIAYEPERLSTMRLDAKDMFTGVGRYALVDLGGGRTRVEYESEFRMTHPLARLFEPLVTPQARKKAIDDLRRLEQQIETAADPARPPHDPVPTDPGS